jgi:hypothetical protein
MTWAASFSAAAWVCVANGRWVWCLGANAIALVAIIAARRA